MNQIPPGSCRSRSTGPATYRNHPKLRHFACCVAKLENYTMMVIASRWFTQKAQRQGWSHYFCHGDLSKEFIILITHMLKMLIYILSELDTFSQKYFNILCVEALNIKYFYYDTQNFCHINNSPRNFNIHRHFHLTNNDREKFSQFILCCA